MFSLLLALFVIIIGYLVGSVCSAIIISRLFNLPDPCLEGSKNLGATNVLRLSGTHYAVIVLLADMLKGLLPVLLARALTDNIIIIGFTCLATVIGHIYPLFFDFKGGKGVATALGALLGFHFMLGVVAIATWLIIANFFRYSSLASILTITLVPFYSLFAFHSPNAFIPLMMMTFFILYKHKDNISRLMDGKETKIHFSSKTQPAHKAKQAAQPTKPKAKAKTPTKTASKLKSSDTAKTSVSKKKAGPKTSAKPSTTKKVPKTTEKTSAEKKVEKPTKPKKTTPPK